LKAVSHVKENRDDRRRLSNTGVLHPCAFFEQEWEPHPTSP
jgi:hypothetical protein